MRDITRITRVIGKILKLWSNHPDWRLGQLLVNVLIDIGIDTRQKDIFYVEDTDVEKAIDSWMLKERK